MKFKIPLWLLFSVLSMLMNGTWGALVELPEKKLSPPFPTTLGYILWSLTFIPCAIYLLYRIKWKQFLENIFGNILPVVHRTKNLGCTSFTNRAIELMGMEALYDTILINPGAVHPVWDCIKQMSQLKKISISRWCDEDYMGDALEGTDIVYSRNPDPKYLGINVSLDEESWREHIRKTIKATRRVFTEFIMRDIYTVHGNLDKVRRSVEIAREKIDRHYHFN